MVPHGTLHCGQGGLGQGEGERVREHRQHNNNRAVRMIFMNIQMPLSALMRMM